MKRIAFISLCISLSLNAQWPKLAFIDLTQSTLNAEISYNDPTSTKISVKAGEKKDIGLDIHGRWGNPNQAIKIDLIHPFDSSLNHTTYAQLSQVDNSAPMKPTLLKQPNKDVIQELPTQESVGLKIVANPKITQSFVKSYYPCITTVDLRKSGFNVKLRRFQEDKDLDIISISKGQLQQRSPDNQSSCISNIPFSDPNIPSLEFIVEYPSGKVAESRRLLVKNIRRYEVNEPVLFFGPETFHGLLDINITITDEFKINLEKATSA